MSPQNRNGHRPSLRMYVIRAIPFPLPRFLRRLLPICPAWPGLHIPSPARPALCGPSQAATAPASWPPRSLAQPPLSHPWSLAHQVGRHCWHGPRLSPLRSLLCPSKREPVNSRTHATTAQHISALSPTLQRRHSPLTTPLPKLDRAPDPPHTGLAARAAARHRPSSPSPCRTDAENTAISSAVSSYPCALGLYALRVASSPGPNLRRRSSPHEPWRRSRGP